jgi:hypothetical protein
MTTKQTFATHDEDMVLRALLGTLLDNKWLIASITVVPADQRAVLGIGHAGLPGQCIRAGGAEGADLAGHE